MAAHKLKERINNCGIRHDKILYLLTCSQAYLSQMLNGVRVMPEEIEDRIETYIEEIEIINKKYFN